MTKLEQAIYDILKGRAGAGIGRDVITYKALSTLLKKQGFKRVGHRSKRLHRALGGVPILPHDERG